MSFLYSIARDHLYLTGAFAEFCFSCCDFLWLLNTRQESQDVFFYSRSLYLSLREPRLHFPVCHVSPFCLDDFLCWAVNQPVVCLTQNTRHLVAFFLRTAFQGSTAAGFLLPLRPKKRVR